MRERIEIVSIAEYEIQGIAAGKFTNGFGTGCCSIKRLCFDDISLLR